MAYIGMAYVVMAYVGTFARHIVPVRLWVCVHAHMRTCAHARMCVHAHARMRAARMRGHECVHRCWCSSLLRALHISYGILVMAY